MYKNKKIFILGLARSGYAAAKLLAKDNQVTINDMNNNQDPKQIEELENLGVNIVLGSHPDEILTPDYDVLIKNPGIKENHKYIEFCHQNNIPVINEVELAYHYLPKNVTIIGITGSNGKTTTTTLIYEILKKGNRNVHLTGNIGFPLSSFIGKIKENDIVVIEISDQQLFNFIDFKTNISVLTNLSYAHLDLHGGSFENYILNKKKVFNHHTKEDLASINLENAPSLKITKDINSSKIYFSSKNICNGAYLKDDKIYYYDKEIINTKDVRLNGVHNYENIMCAIIVAINMNIDINDICEVVKSFSGVEHRLEFVRNLNGVEYYNDSKSTNNKSTQIALSAFNKPTIILLGGLDRGQLFDELLPFMKNVRSIICYGQTKEKIAEFALKNKINCTVVNNLKEATTLAYNTAENGDVVLLSPACASWDQYKKFEDRGDEFKKIVSELK